jgi:site-specific DNA recombinase
MGAIAARDATEDAQPARTIEQLREHMPPLRQREQALREEARAIADQSNDSAMFLRLAGTLTAFLTRLRNSANTLDVMERQRIVRLVVKDVLIGDDILVIRHCIPIVAPSPSGGAPPAAGTPGSAQISHACLPLSHRS